MATKATKPLRRPRGARKTPRRFEPRPMLYADALTLRKEARRRGRDYRCDIVNVLVNATLQLDKVAPRISCSPRGAALAAALKDRDAHAARRQANYLTRKPISNVADLLTLAECAKRFPGEGLADVLLEAMHSLYVAPIAEAE